MYRLNKICSSLFLLLIMSVVSVSAQKITTENGYPVIDLSDLSPLGCILSSSEASTRRAEMNAQTPSNSENLAVGESVSYEYGSWNLKLSIKYQVMRADHPEGATDWANAYTLCKNYSGEGGSAGEWRLPTYRELQMIWILHPQLINKGGFTAFTTNGYWSSTEYTPIYTWYVSFKDGFMDGYGSKKGTYIQRCVKDL